MRRPFKPDRLRIRRSLLVKTDGRLPAMFNILETGVYGRPDRVGSAVGNGDTRWKAADPDASKSVPLTMQRKFEKKLNGTLIRPGRWTEIVSGLIVSAADGRPVVIEQEGIWVITGFGGDGLALAPATGEKITRELLA
jgi:glycine/D-amino acid oxidase-like deaminating enzyme